MIRPLLAALLLGASVAAHADTVVVTADRMVDVLAARVVDRPQIVVTDGRIAAVGHQGDAAPAGARRVALPGMTLLPGLIDMHVHLTSVAAIRGYRSLQYTDAFWTAAGVANALTTLRAGFTTVRNVGSDGFEDVGIRQAVDAGLVPGPRIVTATYAIGSTGGHCDDNRLPPSYDRKGDSVVNGAEEARAKVRWLKKYGAQVIKICATGGVFSVGDAPGAQQLTAEEIRAVTSEAHMLGLRVAAHAHGDAGIRAAIDNGVDTIEHASLASAETIADAKRHGTWFDMDIYNDDYILATGEANGTLPESIEKERKLGRQQRGTFRAAVRAGVPMLFGTDAGVYPHGDNARQFAKMVEWGMTPMQALQAATASAARALDREADVGAIAPGRYGDMIAVAGDPMVDIRKLETIAFVMKGGEVVKGAANP